MTRSEVEELLKGAGIEAPTKESIDAFLNKHNAEIQKEKALSDKYKNDAIKVSDLEAQLEALNNQNLSEIDLAKKETEKSNSKVAELEKKLRDMEMKNKLAGIGIVGEDADKLFGADGSLDTSILGQIISAREETAKSLKEKELLNNTPNPRVAITMTDKRQTQREWLKWSARVLQTTVQILKAFCLITQSKVKEKNYAS